MQRMTMRALAALVLTVGVLAATNSGAVRPVAAPADATLITPAWTPLGVGNQSVTVVIQLPGDPVAVQQANAGRKLNQAEKDQIKAQLKGKQDSLRASIQSLGGTILGTYQASYNGIKVRIARDKVDALRALPGITAVRPVQIFKPSNVRGIPLIGAPNVWGSLGLHGEGIKVAIIDSGIDYTHANFGGPGTAAAYTAAHARETLRPIRLCSVPRPSASREVSTSSATATTPPRPRRLTNRSRTRTRIRSTAEVTARTLPAPPPGRA